MSVLYEFKWRAELCVAVFVKLYLCRNIIINDAHHYVQQCVVYLRHNYCDRECANNKIQKFRLTIK